MRNRPTLFAVLLLPLLALLAGCLSHRGSSQEVANDLHNYSLEMQKWEPKEKSIFQSIDDVEQSQYVDDDFVARTLKSALPTLDEHLREVAAYRPATVELNQLHEHYRKGWEELRGALDAMIGAEGKKDYVALAKGKSQLKSARNRLMRAFAEMDGLMEDAEEGQKGMRKS